ncbi:MAG: two-component system response regulator [Nitrospirae bacterium]|nr:two-component system response regulator [Nitrospirota bacterium]
MVADLKKQTVLVVDDTPENIEIINGLLSPFYQIKVALNGEKALKIAISQNPPDLILLDIMMPGMDGYEVCRRLKADLTTKGIPVIFLTAKTEVEDEAKGFEVGAVDYIMKPISPPIVLARVRTQLALYDQNRELEEKVRQRTTEIHETRVEIIRRLGRAAEFKDNETGLHVIRMSYYSRLIALSHGLNISAAEMIYQASPMHDIGKIGIPDRILQKTAKLDDDEWVVMKEHCAIGDMIIGRHDSELLEMARVIALTHHEMWDGSGYPNGTAGQDIPIEGRIIAIADVFDALTSKRPYKEAWPVEEAVDLIENTKGQHFDPALVEAFANVLPEIIEIKENYVEQHI